MRERVDRITQQKLPQRQTLLVVNRLQSEHAETLLVRVLEVSRIIQGADYRNGPELEARLIEHLDMLKQNWQRSSVA